MAKLETGAEAKVESGTGKNIGRNVMDDDDESVSTPPPVDEAKLSQEKLERERRNAILDDIGADVNRGTRARKVVERKGKSDAICKAAQKDGDGNGAISGKAAKTVKSGEKSSPDQLKRPGIFQQLIIFVMLFVVMVLVNRLLAGIIFYYFPPGNGTKGGSDPQADGIDGRSSIPSTKKLGANPQETDDWSDFGNPEETMNEFID